MRKYVFILSLLALGCSHKAAQVIYQDRTIVSFDTIRFEAPKDGTTVPCKDFETFIQGETIHDTIFVKSKQGKLELKAQLERKVTERQPIIVTPQPNVRIRKIDNSITAKKQGIIGNDNTMTTKKTNWWWIFVAGMLTMFIIQNVIYKTLKRYLIFIP